MYYNSVFWKKFEISFMIWNLETKLLEILSASFKCEISSRIWLKIRVRNFWIEKRNFVTTYTLIHTVHHPICGHPICGQNPICGRIFGARKIHKSGTWRISENKMKNLFLNKIILNWRHPDLSSKPDWFPLWFTLKVWQIENLKDFGKKFKICYENLFLNQSGLERSRNRLDMW